MSLPSTYSVPGSYDVKLPTVSTKITADEEEHVAHLVHSDEYAKYANQVASVSTHKILFVKRKELAMKPYELIQFHMTACTSITYEKKLAIVPMIFGALLIALVLFILNSEVAAGTRVPVGALAIVLIFGAILFSGLKRHQLTFVVNDKRLKWKSKAGDFKYKVSSTQKKVAFAKEKGLLNVTNWKRKLTRCSSRSTYSAR